MVVSDLFLLDKIDAEPHPISQTSKVELRAELETLAATAHSGSSIATGPSPPSLEEMARVAQVVGWGEGEPVEMALRLIRGSRPESPYYKVSSKSRFHSEPRS